jgi:hypothetical protein
VQDYVLDDAVTYANITPCLDGDLLRHPRGHCVVKKSTRSTAAIEAIVPVADKKITGRTTRLDLSASEAQVDRNSWVMP